MLVMKKEDKIIKTYPDSLLLPDMIQALVDDITELYGEDRRGDVTKAVYGQIFYLAIYNNQVNLKDGYAIENVKGE